MEKIKCPEKNNKNKKFNIKKQLMEILQPQPTCIDVNMEYDKNFEQWFLLSSDRHRDNPKSNRKLQKQHLDKAKEIGAGIIDIGDLFCAMQGKYDKRKNKDDLREEHKSGKYLDKLVSTAVDRFSPYAKNLVNISPGNHEHGVLKKHETDLTERLIEGLNMKTGSNIKQGTYAGWIRFMFRHKAGGQVRKVLLNYTHGYGGGGPVTKGVIQTNRMGVYLPQADIIVSGHVHEERVVTLCQERLKQNGESYIHKVRHLSIPTYKEEYLQGEGFHREGGRPPKPIGAWWIKFYNSTDDSGKTIIKYQILNAD